MTRWLLIALTFVTLAGCKDRGTIDIDVVIDGACLDDATHVRVYMIAGAECCMCGDCADKCTGDACTLGCNEDGTGYCTIEEFRDGIGVTPPSGGTYAVFYQLVSMTTSPPQEIASACAQVEFSDDGTSDGTAIAAGQCCSTQ